MFLFNACRHIRSASGIKELAQDMIRQERAKWMRKALLIFD